MVTWLIIIERMIQLRGAQGLKITKVKGHADDDMVAVGRVRVEDRVGNEAFVHIAATN